MQAYLTEDDYVEDKQFCYNGTEQHPEFTKHHVLKPKLKEKTLKPYLKKAGFPQEIVLEADRVFSQMKSGLKRGSRRNQLMFFCANEAYNNLGISENPSRIAKMCDISYSEMVKASSMCSPSKTNYNPQPVHRTPADLLPGLYQTLVDLEILAYSDEIYQDIKNICDEVEKDAELIEEKPQTVAAAILVFYLSLHSCAIEKKRYTEIFGLSDMTILKVKNKVAKVYNS